jgi:hypothetical protein
MYIPLGYDPKHKEDMLVLVSAQLFLVVTS